ncbi:hypothetical protein GCM10011309_08160 [Litorimonas cladophorae]|uniref:Uncharacterized protein n=1 Tax=Litorimonas cladophorae TaxID=1220491 RepID=A0A918KEW4_9PROT|nr:hypothetical protein [Litorimonas cladophorae]GGX60691.1 hypothetical protein GCM10011309_08160 [Litorimonas cladophorae]
MSKSKLLLLATIAAVGIMPAGMAHAQNVLVNSDFSQGAPSTMGNHVNQFSPPGWAFGPGQSPNVVTVDGPGGYNYGTNGPQSDATGTGNIQHYLDIANGGNSFYQTFTPTCSGNVEFGGAFSTRGNGAARASIAIRQGNGLNGTLVGTTQQTSLPRGTSMTDPWRQVSYTTALQAGQTYSFVVTMDNNSNFDDGFVEFDNCPSTDSMIDLCCTPWTETKSGAALQPVPGPGGLFSNYTVKYQAIASSNTQMVAYANYLDVVDPAFEDLKGTFTVAAYGNGATPNSSGVSVPGAGQQQVNWGGTNGTYPSNAFWSGFPFQQNTWYGFTTTVIARDAQRNDLGLFEESCEPTTVYYRVQSMGGARSMVAGRPAQGSNGGFILQKSDGRRITSSEVLETKPKENRFDRRDIRKRPEPRQQRR